MQEESFKKLSGRWIPEEDRVFIGHLNRFNIQMRSWAKKSCIPDLSSLKPDKYSELLGTLSKMVLLNNNQLPNGISMNKAPHLFLTALVAHDLYRSVICKPFLFEEGFADDGTKLCHKKVLEQVYRSIQSCRSLNPYINNLLIEKREAHIWRSQTLRLLRPPMGNIGEPVEKALCERTNEQIASAALLQAKNFLSGPARHIIQTDLNLECGLEERLIHIYKEAADIAYKLWTQRITIKCSTLQDLPIFDPENVCLELHSSVHVEEHKDQLLGRPIEVVIYPLLQAYGNADAENYDAGRVLTPAMVWLDSRKEG
ncbi:hypothetical protein CJF30_00010804 [Rutstroemia sp. NJR-2017a BBW]|nr:hypothetical protein CJF30_00010804 [Rutstroemia sp. NJR-2017a BBW]